MVLVVHRWRPPHGVTRQRVHDVLSAVALHASIIIDREQGEREHDLLRLLEDRDRIARDLHDLVIQRLFAVGLTLQGASRRAVRPEVAERLENAVDELDQTIRDIRATIFELRHHPGAGTFRADLRQLAESYTPTLGFAPVLLLTGPLDSITDDAAQTQVLMVVREALSNVARHAHASSASVEVEAGAGRLTITVTDDGVGIGSRVVESGLGNVRARAHEHGGAVELSPAEPHGTRLRWSIPL
jgi:signal transduction histidine kinase